MTKYLIILYLLIITISCSTDDSDNSNQPILDLPNNNLLKEYAAIIPNRLISSTVPKKTGENNLELINNPDIYKNWNIILDHDKKNRIISKSNRIHSIGINESIIDRNYKDSIVYENKIIKIFAVFKDNAPATNLIAQIKVDDFGKVIEKTTHQSYHQINDTFLGHFLNSGVSMYSKYFYDNDKLIKIRSTQLNSSNPDEIITNFTYDVNGNLTTKITTLNDYLFISSGPSNDASDNIYSKKPSRIRIIEEFFLEYDTEKNLFQPLIIFDETLNIAVSNNNFKTHESKSYFMYDQDENLNDEIVNYSTKESTGNSSFSSFDFIYEKKEKGFIAIAIKP